MKRVRPARTQDRLVIKIKGDLVPRYHSTLAAGCDLRAAIDREIVIHPGDFCTIPTGIRLEIPEGYEAQVRPRSGLAGQRGIGVLNSPGTIDADYRGEVKVILFNHGSRPFRIKRRDRIAQLVFSRVERVRFVRAKRLNRTQRQAGGLGHTGS
ncbi:dUTP diphosphatase [candidate division WOR-3 bacterium]|nr:dUTP diphosphatase [candidate division WOR-3 bacterium]